MKGIVNLPKDGIGVTDVYFHADEPAGKVCSLQLVMGIRNDPKDRLSMATAVAHYDIYDRDDGSIDQAIAQLDDIIYMLEKAKQYLLDSGGAEISEPVIE